MGYEIGDRMTCVSDTGLIREGEEVEVIAVDDDGVPSVAVMPTDDAPAGRAVRLGDPQIAESFELAAG